MFYWRIGIPKIINDISDEIIEVDTHIHSFERWVGAAAVPDGEIHVADTDSMTAFQADAGNDTWGAWLQILGSGDTPLISGKARYDMHRIFITGIERFTALHRLQVGFGTSGAAALTAGEYTEVLFKPAGAAAEESPHVLQSNRDDAGTKAWVRVWADGGNTGTVDCFFGIHEYDI